MKPIKRKTKPTRIDTVRTFICSPRDTFNGQLFRVSEFNFCVNSFFVKQGFFSLSGPTRIFQSNLSHQKTLNIFLISGTTSEKPSSLSDLITPSTVSFLITLESSEFMFFVLSSNVFISILICFAPVLES